MSSSPVKAKISTGFRYAMVVCGAASLAYAMWRMPLPHLDVRFVLLAAITMIVSSRFAVKVPRVNTNVTVSDTFIFLALLVYGGFAGIFLAAAEGLFSGIRISKTTLTVAFNSAMMAVSTFLTVLIVEFFFGPIANLRFQEWQHFIPAVGAMALSQYFINTGISAIGLSLEKVGLSFPHVADTLSLDFDHLHLGQHRGGDRLQFFRPSGPRDSDRRHPGHFDRLLHLSQVS